MTGVAARAPTNVLPARVTATRMMIVKQVLYVESTTARPPMLTHTKRLTAAWPTPVTGTGPMTGPAAVRATSVRLAKGTVIAMPTVRLVLSVELITVKPLMLLPIHLQTAARPTPVLEMTTTGVVALLQVLALLVRATATAMLTVRLALSVELTTVKQPMLMLTQMPTAA